MRINSKEDIIKAKMSKPAVVESLNLPEENINIVKMANNDKQDTAERLLASSAGISRFKGGSAKNSDGISGGCFTTNSNHKVQY